MELNLTSDGFLANIADWSPDVAETFARQQNMTLTAAHWEIITIVRDFYLQYNTAPSMRAIVNAMRIAYGPEKGNSIYIQQLFPDSATIMINKIAGLPKPLRCI